MTSVYQNDCFTGEVPEKKGRKCPHRVTRLMRSLCLSHLCCSYICEDPVQSKRSHRPLFFALDMLGSPGVSSASLAVPYVLSVSRKRRDMIFLVLMS